MKKANVFLFFSLFIVLVLTFVLLINKSFFKNYCVLENGDKYFVPRFSFFLSDSDGKMEFYSIYSDEKIISEINSFYSFCSESLDCDYVYDYSYDVFNDGLFKKIIIYYKKN